MKTFAEKVISFYSGLEYTGAMPEGIAIMNPFRQNQHVIPVISSFYSKYYNDVNYRHLILGINPGRFGGGVTGIPFTDSKRLSEKCGLTLPGIVSFETSSVFFYDMIDAYGGTDKFYSHFYISSVVPLGFTSLKTTGRIVNYNYYDSKELTKTVYRFIIDSLSKQLEFGIKRDVCFCLGTGENYKFIVGLNRDHRLFETIVPLEHPRFIMQYRSKSKEMFISKYLDAFSKYSEDSGKG